MVKNISLLASAAILLCISSCGNNYEFKKLSDFTICDSCVREEVPVDIIYRSGGPDYNNDQQYYYRFIIVVKNSGDTFNVLSVWNSVIPKDSKDVLFIPRQSEMARIIGEISGGHPQKVVSNLRFESFENRNYPTLIGMLGIRGEGTIPH